MLKLSVYVDQQKRFLIPKIPPTELKDARLFLFRVQVNSPSRMKESHFEEVGSAKPRRKLLSPQPRVHNVLIKVSNACLKDDSSKPAQNLKGRSPILVIH